MTKHVDLELDILKLPLVEFIKVKGLQVRHYNIKQDAAKLVSIFNRIWVDSGIPDVTLTEEKAKKLPAEKVFVAEYNGEMVGFIVFDVVEENGEKKGIFRFIGVLRDYRGKKIASAMAFRAGEDLLRHGIQKLKSFIPEKNQKALNFIKFFGFEEKEDVEYSPEFPD